MDNIEIFLRKAVKDGVFPGCCAVTIHKDTSRFYCTGNLQIQPSIINNTIDTMYDMASLTKVIVTTTLTLQMMEKHLFTLDTPVRKILPQFSHDHVKIAHLLTHTSGLPADHPDKRNICKEQLEKDIFHMDLLFEPGAQVLYSDLGFILLKDILETVTDTPLESLAKKQIFDPLHMPDTCFNPVHKEFCAPTTCDETTHRYLQGTVHDTKCRKMGGISGHAGLFSTITDMSHFLSMLVHNGIYDGNIILNATSMQYLHTVFTPPHTPKRTLGYLCKDENSIFSSLSSPVSIAHTGFTGTSILCDFENHLGIVLLSNRIHPTRENTAILSWRKQFHDVVYTQILK